MDTDPITEHVRRIAELETICEEVKALRRVVWLLANENGGGLTLRQKDIDLVPESVLIECWKQIDTQTFHIRAS